MIVIPPRVYFTDQQINGGGAQLFITYLHGGQRGFHHAGDRQIVKADNRNIVGHAESTFM